MITYVFMGFLLLGIAFSTLWGAKYTPLKDSFMSIEDATFLRGFWCIIVALVHVPEPYQNRVQNMLGSFAYIGVTFFFLTSAYGLKYNMRKKRGYMNYFWRRRLPSILIPALIANAFQVFIYGLNGQAITVLSFININTWVKILLLYYVFFWLIYHVFPKVIKVGCWQDILMCLIVVSCSLIDRLTNFKITSIWIVEPLGFAYGILAANYGEQIKQKVEKRWLVNCFVLMFVSGILGVAYLKFKTLAFFGDYLLKIILGYVITVFIFTVIGKTKVGNKANSFLANISYEVYLLHHIVYKLIIMAIDNGSMNSGLFVVVSLVITIALAYSLSLLCRPVCRKLSDIGG